MRLLAVEARQNGSYNLGRYHQAESLGAELFVLNGEGVEGFWRPGRYRIVGSAHIHDIIAAAKSWHAEVNFDGVLTFAESALIATAAVAEAITLPGIGVQAARNSRNKVLMHQAHQSAGAPVARFRYAPTVDDGLAAAREFGYPVVIKPALGASSNFVFRADSPPSFLRCFGEAARGVRTMKWTRLEADGIDLGPAGLVVESYLDGSEHLIEAYAWDGEVVLTSVVDRLDADQLTFEENVHQAPTALTGDQLDKIAAALTAAAQGQGIRRSALHAEVRFDAGEPYVLEISPKPGGGGLEHLARVSAGYCPITAHMRIACGQRPEATGYRPTGIYTAARALVSKAGLITGIEVPAAVTESPDLLFCRVIAEPGDVIKRPPEGNGVLGFLGATGPTRASAMKAADRLAALISVTITD
ncbi:MAG TPA: ATP-grasp domain-containing protein [Streptosporangiaceae bacterium]|nr:ATP-grasp domain-containing protein [Streptosporangiaceae bacterium]